MNEKYRQQSLRMFSYGVYVLSSVNEGEYCVSTITWASQASFEPPMISVCIKRNSASYEIVKKRGEFILHLLGDNQKELASTFFKSTGIKFGYVEHIGVSIDFLDFLRVLDFFRLHLPVFLFCFEPFGQRGIYY